MSILDQPTPLELDTAPRTPKLLLSQQEAADALSVSLSTFRRLINSDDIKAVYPSPKSPRYDPRDLIAWIDSHKQSTDQQTP